MKTFFRRFTNSTQTMRTSAWHKVTIRCQDAAKSKWNSVWAKNLNNKMIADFSWTNMQMTRFKKSFQFSEMTSNPPKICGLKNSLNTRSQPPTKHLKVSPLISFRTSTLTLSNNSTSIKWWCSNVNKTNFNSRLLQVLLPHRARSLPLILWASWTTPKTHRRHHQPKVLLESSHHLKPRRS